MTLKSSVALGAKSNEIGEAVRGFPVVAKITPRNNVVDIKSMTMFSLCLAAFLADITVVLTSFLALLIPVGTAPLFVSALPVAMVIALLPFSGALIGTKAPSILPALNFVAMHFDSLAANLTDEPCLARLALAFFATKSYFASLVASKIDLEGLVAYLAPGGDCCTFTAIVAFYRTETVFAALLSRERFTASLADRLRQFQCLPKALAGAIALRRTNRLEYSSANQAGAWVHSFVRPAFLIARPRTILSVRMFGIVYSLLANGTFLFHVPSIPQFGR